MIPQKILITTLLAASIASGPQPIQNMRGINSENLLHYAPSMPKSVETVIEKFFKQHPAILSVLSGESYYHRLPRSHHAPFSIDFDKLSRKDKKFSSTLKKSLSDIRPNIVKKNYNVLYNNLVINVDDQWFIKASSLFNRRSNILYEMGLKHHNSKLPQAKLKEFIANKGGRTFQTISRMFYWLRAQQAQKELHLDRICLPQKYLVHIPGRPTVIDDTNYVIVAEKLSGALPILETDLLNDKEVVAQLAHIILRASLFDIHGDNVLAKDGKACIIDFEQPSGCKPSEFGCENNTGQGIEGLKVLIRKHAQNSKQDLTYLEDLVTEIVNSYTT